MSISGAKPKPKTWLSRNVWKFWPIWAKNSQKLEQFSSFLYDISKYRYKFALDYLHGFNKKQLKSRNSPKFADTFGLAAA